MEPFSLLAKLLLILCIILKWRCMKNRVNHFVTHLFQYPNIINTVYYKINIFLLTLLSFLSFLIPFLFFFDSQICSEYFAAVNLTSEVTNCCMFFLVYFFRNIKQYLNKSKYKKCKDIQRTQNFKYCTMYFFLHYIIDNLQKI